MTRSPLFGSIGLCGLILCLVQSSAGGQLVRISQILNYTNGPLGQAGNTEGWNNTSGNISVTNGSGSLDGTALGLTPSRGDKAEINATEALNVYNLFAASGQFRSDRSTNLYYSFLYRFNNAADVSSSFERIFQVNRQNSGSAYTLQAIARESGGKLQVGVMKTNGTPAFASRNIEPWEVVFLVFRHQIVPPAGAGDIVDVWVNPPPATFGIDETVTAPPAPDATATDGGEDTSNTGPGRFYLASGVNATFDELRIGTNWADVTPSAAVCDPAGVTADPANVTTTEGLNATFAIAAVGSSPLFQWQVSTNGGTTWNNVTSGSGMNSTRYTTSFTRVGDSGQQFRAIVTVTCGTGSSATSAPAMLTVKQAVPTSPGLVVDDFWTNDFSQNTLPVTTNNSVWFASSAGSLYVDNVNNTLVATPVSGSSTLWVGYYTDDTETNLPVHLDVNRAIRATLRFKASGISATGGGLRIGLFDYADDGTRLGKDGFGSGSSGNGQNVRGYMLNVNFSSTFDNNSPLTLYARTALDSANLMGSTGDFQSLGSGPAGWALSGASAFADGTEYTMEFSVARTNEVGVLVTASISGGGTNWTHSVADTSFNYHRFDAIGIRPATQETSASWFEIPEFKVEVLQIAAPPTPIPLTVQRSGSDVVLTWDNPAFGLEAAPQISAVYTNVPDAKSPYTVSAGAGQQFFRLKATY